jgi:tetratricopeptide (TPR) repeat protein
MTGALKPEEALGPELDAATKAVQLDDSQPEAHLALCAAIFINQWDIERADKECLRAIQLDPKFAEPYHFRARLLSALSRHDEAIQAQKKATEMDPTARPWAMPDTILRARQFDAAIQDARQRLEAYPRDEHLLSVLYDAYRRKGMDKEAEDTMERQLQVAGNPQLAAFLHSLYVKGGSKAVLRWKIRDLESRSTHQYIPPVFIAALYAQLGNREKTLLLLEDGFREHSPFLLWVQWDPAYDFLHSDPHYRLLIQRTGLPPAY